MVRGWCRWRVRRSTQEPERAGTVTPRARARERARRKSRCVAFDSSTSAFSSSSPSLFSSLSAQNHKQTTRQQPPKIQQSKEAKALAAANSSKGKKKVRRFEEHSMEQQRRRRRRQRSEKERVCDRPLARSPSVSRGLCRCFTGNKLASCREMGSLYRLSASRRLFGRRSAQQTAMKISFDGGGCGGCERESERASLSLLFSFAHPRFPSSTLSLNPPPPLKKKTEMVQGKDEGEG